ncbi:MAG: hypothetical protein ACLQQ4_08560 [Bacteroidia bacterium]
MAAKSNNNTPEAGENMLRLTTAEQINEAEVKGVIEGEKFILTLDENIEISASLLLQINKVAFGHLYAWAGKWRDKLVQVGAFLPPEPKQIPNLIYQFADAHNYSLLKDLIKSELTLFPGERRKLTKASSTILLIFSIDKPCPSSCMVSYTDFEIISFR